ncbi:TetR family transcriptional regulator [Streptacidiphilus sp. PB12-B1b]|uniref:TetR family transcriptional regulator n=1 Tax=Streptacidiphilus sp. PB12-B1b TaxID=2705012 RepID=UPI0015FD35CC|nr:TetR family transcriptional regulator [Streptacidiphilus sp. PB12-B1b]QMU79195.1 TetR family transcriptional regulator [Streptacidiphilus sp. PB12-B1b]
MAIDRDLATRTALRLLDEEGLERLSLRRVAQELNVPAPALYRHFTTRRALMDRMTDLMLAPSLPDLDPPVEPGEWPQWLLHTAEVLRRELLAHTDGARLALGADLRRAGSLGACFERTVVVLHQAGFGLVHASRAAGAFIALVLGRTAEEQSGPGPAGEGGATRLAHHPGASRAAARAAAGRRAAGESPEEALCHGVTAMVEALRAADRERVPA